MLKLPQAPKAKYRLTDPFRAINGLSLLQIEAVLTDAASRMQQQQQVGNMQAASPDQKRTWVAVFEELAQANSTNEVEISPVISIVPSSMHFRVRHDRDVLKRIRRKISRLANFESGQRSQELLRKQLVRHIAWRVRKQRAMLRYICEQQSNFLRSNDGTLLKPLCQKDVANRIGCHYSTLSRLAGVAVMLPDGTVAPAGSLMPTHAQLKKQIVFRALSNLASNPEFFDGSWRISTAYLSCLILRNTGIHMSRRRLHDIRAEWHLSALAPMRSSCSSGYKEASSARRTEVVSRPNWDSKMKASRLG